MLTQSCHTSCSAYMCTILTVNTFSGNAAMPQRDSKRWVQSNKCLHPANGKVSISAGLHKKGLVCFISPRRSGVMRPCYLFALSAFSLSSFSFFFCHGNLKFMPMPHASLPSFRCTSPVQVKCQQVTYCTDYHSASATCVQHACHLPCEDKWDENTS